VVLLPVVHRLDLWQFVMDMTDSSASADKSNSGNIGDDNVGTPGLKMPSDARTLINNANEPTTEDPPVRKMYQGCSLL
jgi:hypothetical protein